MYPFDNRDDMLKKPLMREPLWLTRNTFLDDRFEVGKERFYPCIHILDLDEKKKKKKKFG